LSRTKIIHTIHHLASSGGTIVSKTLAAQPDVVLLSELNPNHMPFFAPLDPYPQLIANYPDLFPNRTRDGVFLERINDIYGACEKNGLSLIVRDHSHTDFSLWKVQTPRLRDVLREGGYELRSIATVRNPIDVWLSMNESRFNLAQLSFTVFCERVKLFLDHYSDIPLFRYEDFVAKSAHVVEDMVGALGLRFDPNFSSRMGLIRVSGDSGRLRNFEASKPQFPEGARL
jgi:hypothetical protein